MEHLSKIVNQSFNISDLGKLKMANSSFWLNQLKAVANIIPYAGGLFAEELQICYDYKTDEFFRKFTCYLLGLKETTVEERQQFAEDIQNKAGDFSGNVILGMVDRLDNINKQTILARLTIAKIKDFFRLNSMLERIPYVDINELPKYKDPFYDESGDTDLLYSTGALELHTIDANSSNKYILSKLGEKLLQWGCLINLDVKRMKGMNMELNYATNEDIDSLFDDFRKTTRPRYENETLYFPDGTKSGKLEDEDQFLYDLSKGK